MGSQASAHMVQEAPRRPYKRDQKCLIKRYHAPLCIAMYGPACLYMLCAGELPHAVLSQAGILVRSTSFEDTIVHNTE